MATNKEIGELIKNGNAELLKIIRKEILAVGSKLSSEFAEFSSKINNDITALKDDHLNLKQKVAVLEERLVYFDRRHDVRICNIPVMKDEVTCDIVLKIFDTLGFNSTSIQFTAFRLKPSNARQGSGHNNAAAGGHSSGSSISETAAGNTRSALKKKDTVPDYQNNETHRLTPVIMVKFLSGWDKSLLLKLYYNRKTLNLNDIGLLNSSRIYISENLTPTCYAIYCEAKNLKRAGIISKINSANGSIFVESNAGKSILAVSVSQLKSMASTFIKKP